MSINTTASSVGATTKPNFSGYFHLTLNPDMHDIGDTLELLKLRGINVEPDKFEPISNSQVLIEVPDNEDQLLVNAAQQDFNPSLKAVRVNHEFADFGEFSRAQFQIKTRHWDA